METREIRVQLFSLTSSKSFRELVAAIDVQIGHPDMKAFQQSINAAKNAADLDKVVQGAVGPTGFMEFARCDLGEILRKEQGTKAHPVLRMVIGNPLIMKEMVKLTPDAGSWITSSRRKWRRRFCRKRSPNQTTPPRSGAQRAPFIQPPSRAIEMPRTISPRAVPGFSSAPTRPAHLRMAMHRA